MGPVNLRYDKSLSFAFDSALYKNLNSFMEIGLLLLVISRPLLMLNHVDFDRNRCRIVEMITMFYNVYKDDVWVAILLIPRFCIGVFLFCRLKI